MKKNEYMRMAFKLARKGVGKVSPNPLVGCVIVKNGQIIGQGYHREFGGAHAEINALQVAGKNAQNAEMYVTLEPCCHFGKTPPCTEAILKSGIKKVYIAMQDPNPLVAGKGIEILCQNGIEVEVGLEEAKARQLNEKFIYYIWNKKPFVALKIATTLDGKITRTDGEQWITNLKSRKEVHKLRNEYDAILVGKNTVLKDNPSLTAYLLKNGKNPLRVILDSRLDLPVDKKVFADANFLIVTKEGHSAEKQRKYLKKGGKILTVQSSKLKVESDQVDLSLMVEKLGEMGISSLLVEGGAQVFTGFLNQNLVQKVYWFIAPMVAGEDALMSVFALEKMRFLQNGSFRKIEENFLVEGYLNK